MIKAIQLNPWISMYTMDNVYYPRSDKEQMLCDDCYFELKNLELNEETNYIWATIETPYGERRVTTRRMNVVEVADDFDFKAQKCWDTECGYKVGDVVLYEQVRYSNAEQTAYDVIRVDGPMIQVAGPVGGCRWLRHDKVTLLARYGETYTACCQSGAMLTEDEVDADHVAYVISNNNYIVHGFVCDDMKEGLYRCEDCGRLMYDESDIVYIESLNKCVCSKCLDENGYRRCDNCGEWFASDDTICDDYSTYCNDCFEELNLVQCENCYRIIDADEAYEYEGSYYCADCAPEEATCPDGFHDYYYKPNPRFHKLENENTELFMGVELEIDKGNNKRECVNGLYDIGQDEALFYMKHDGSLDDEGIEIVTHPCTLDYHLNEFPWNEVTSMARSHGYKSHDAETCGLHVHVSRFAFGGTEDLQDLNIAKTLLIFDSCWDDLVKFSRRRESQLDHWASKPGAEIDKSDTELTATLKKRKYENERDRYRAVNLKNRNTVEFRLFRGTLVVSTIRATLQLLWNLVNYVNSHKLIDVQGAKFADIVNYKHWDELDAYVASRGIEL